MLHLLPALFLKHDTQCIYKILTKDIQDPVILGHVVPLEFVVCCPAGDDLLVMERSRPEPDPALSHVLVGADLGVRVSGANIQGDEALKTDHCVH